MDRLVFKGKAFVLHEYSDESEFERHVIQHAHEVFGPMSVYIDIKKRIGEDNILTIPDGYLIDFSFSMDPRLYIIENELVTHDPYKHIGQQLLKFAISYKASGRNIKTFLLDKVLKSDDKKKLVEDGLTKAGYRNIDDFLENLIFEKPVSAIVIIDEITSDLENVLSQLSMKTDIVEFQTFEWGPDLVHKFTPFQSEIRGGNDNGGHYIDPAKLDTIVVPANEEGFKKVFLGEECLVRDKDFKFYARAHQIHRRVPDGSRVSNYLLCRSGENRKVQRDRESTSYTSKLRLRRLAR